MALLCPHERIKESVPQFALYRMNPRQGGITSQQGAGLHLSRAFLEHKYHEAILELLHFRKRQQVFKKFQWTQ